MKIGIKLTLLMIVLNIFSISAVGVVLLARSQSNITGLANANALSFARESSWEIKTYLEGYWYTAETMAQMMSQYTHIPLENRRALLNIILEGAVRDNPEIIGVWSVWEPNALEGNDRKFLGAPGTNKDGRFAPYWYWEKGEVQQEILDDYDTGDYYKLVKNSGTTMIYEPYIDRVDQNSVFMTTLASPVKSEDGKFVGAVGVDINMDGIQKICQSNMGTKFKGSTLTAVFTNSGIIAGHFETERLGKNMRDTEKDMAGSHLDALMKAIQEGREFSFTVNNPVLKTDINISTVPIKIASSRAPWSYAVGIANNVIMAPVYDMVRITAYISLAILAVVILAALFLSRSISRPIINVANTLRK